jgi:hypothetical protein
LRPEDTRCLCQQIQLHQAEAIEPYDFQAPIVGAQLAQIVNRLQQDRTAGGNYLLTIFELPEEKVFRTTRPTYVKSMLIYFGVLEPAGFQISFDAGVFFGTI